MKPMSRILWLALPLVAGCFSDEPAEQPSPLSDESPFEFPVALWDQGIEGETLLMVHVTALGDVDSAYVQRSSGYMEFDSAAVAGARKLRFMPGRQGERRVDMWARLPVRFSKTGATTPGATEAVQ